MNDWPAIIIVAASLFASTGAASADPPGRELSFPPAIRLAVATDAVDQREIDQRFADLQREITDHASNDQRALVTALAAIDQRLASMNEFRGALNDLSKDMSERIVKLEALSSRIETNSGLLTTISNRVSVLETAGSPFAVAQIAKLKDEIERVATLANALETGGGTIARQSQRDILEIMTRLTQIEAKASGAAQLWEILLAMAGFVAVVIGLWYAVHQRTVQTIKR